MNPGQSVKDRAALYIIRDAERAGPAAARRPDRRGHRRQHRHRPGHGRQGAGLPHHHRHPAHPEPGEEGRHPPAAAPSWSRWTPSPTPTPTTTCSYSGRLAEELAAKRAGRRDLGQPVRQRRQPRGPRRDHRPGDLGPDRRQGRRLHLRGRLRRHPGRRRRRPCARGSPTSPIGLADPHGAALYSYYTDGELKAEGTSITEGIGQGRITANLEGLTIDHAYRIPDEEMLQAIFDLVEHEGLCMGGSTGINVAGADPHGPGPGPRPHHRDHPLRPRLALPEQAVQPGLPARERACRRPPWTPE